MRDLLQSERPLSANALVVIESQGSVIRHLRPRTATSPTQTPAILSEEQLHSFKSLLSLPTATDYRQMRQRRQAGREAEAQKRHDRRLFLVAKHRDESMKHEKDEDRREQEKIQQQAQERALAMNIENDEALRKACSVILGAKCFAVQSAQMAASEHQPCNEAQSEESADIFEKLRQREEKDALKRKAQGLQVAEAIQEQMKAKQELNSRLERRSDLVKQLERQAAQKIRREEAEKKAQQRLLKVKRASEFKEHLNATAACRGLEAERVSAEEASIERYALDRAEAEARADAHRAQQRLARERETQRIRLVQQLERARVAQDEDARVTAALEQQERKWRAEEQAQALKRSKDRVTVRQQHLVACAEADERKQRVKAAEMEAAQKYSQDFAAKAKTLDAEEAREREEARKTYLSAILEQINSNVSRSRKQRSLSVDDHTRLRLTREAYESRLRQAIKQKYDELLKCPLNQSHLDFVRTKLDQICKEQGLKPISELL